MSNQHGERCLSCAAFAITDHNIHIVATLL
jgi:hypothetical protein